MAAKKPVSSHATMSEGNNTTLDTDAVEKAGKPGKMPPQFAPKTPAPKKPFAGAVKPFTAAEGENPPPQAKKPGKQDNNISAKIPMAPAGAYPNQLPSKPMRDPKKPPVPPVSVGTPNVDDTAAKKKGAKKK